MEKLKLKRNLKYLLWAILFLLFTSTTFIYFKGLQKSVDDIQIQNLDEKTTQQAFSFQSSLENAMGELKMLSYAIRNDIVNPEEYENLLNTILAQSSFKYASISKTNGDTIASTGVLTSVQSDPSFKEAMNGKSIYIDSKNFTFLGNSVIKMATPVYQGNKVVAVLAVAFDQAKLNKYLQKNLNKDSQTYLVLENGEISLLSGKENSAAEINSISNWAKDQDLLKKKQKNEYIQIQQGNVHLIGFVEPVGINNWNLLLTVPSSNFLSSFVYFNNYHLDVLSIVLIFIGTLLYIIFNKYIMRNNQIDVNFVDWLTNGNNINKFRILAKEYLKKNRGKSCVIGVFDIKEFRLINERYGHVEGDQVIRITYKAIESEVNEEGIMGRGHIDRFFILTTFEDDNELISRGQKVRQTLNQMLLEENISYGVDLVSGIYVINQYEFDIDRLLEKANFALRYSKENKEPYTILYNDEITQREVANAQMEEDLQSALTKNEFHVYLQPKYHLQKDCIVGAEALCRWKTSNGELIPPGQFIPVLEKNKKIAALDLYMFETVCQIQREWIDGGHEVFPISVNQSKVLLLRNDYVDTLKEIIGKYKIPPFLISIELTETMIFEEIEKLKGIVESLREIGFSVSIDDFGTGYSSLNLLKDLHVDTVKIDKTFVGDTNETKQSILLVEVIRLIKRLGMEALVEGVEKQDQLDYLKNAGADVCQGYIYDAPIPVKVFFEKYLQEKQLEIVNV